MKSEKFYKDDEIVVIDESSKHFGKSGVIEGLYKWETSSLTGIRYKVKLDISTKYNMIFIFDEDNLELSKQYNRNKKLNKLGID